MLYLALVWYFHSLGAIEHIFANKGHTTEYAFE